MSRTVQIGEVCEIINGSTPSRNENRYWINGTIPWFTIDDLRTQGKNIYNTAQLISKDALKETSIKLLPKNTVLLCCTASIGEVAIARNEMATNQQFNGLIPKEDNLLPEYLYYVLLKMKDRLLKISGNTTINFIAQSKLKKITFQLPSLIEQEKIVAKLDEVFSKIDFSIKGLNQTSIILKMFILLH